jgi:hypothetical protein
MFSTVFTEAHYWTVTWTVSVKSTLSDKCKVGAQNKFEWRISRIVIIPLQLVLRYFYKAFNKFVQLMGRGNLCCYYCGSLYIRGVLEIVIIQFMYFVIWLVGCCLLWLVIFLFKDVISYFVQCRMGWKCRCEWWIWKDMEGDVIALTSCMKGLKRIR